MPTHSRYAAIDIGSNAIRMVISEFRDNKFHMIKKFRVPIRLGADVFDKGLIGAKHLKDATMVFAKFKTYCDHYKVKEARALGTSALRESQNTAQFIDAIQKKSGFHIQVIDGVEEARLIHLAIRKDIHIEDSQALLIDIGGGSVELTFSDRGRMTSTQSFPYGTVRTLEKMKQRKISEDRINLIIAEYIESLSHFLHSRSNPNKIDFMVGTGGNIEAIGKLKPILLNKASKNLVSTKELEEILQKLRTMSHKERIEKLHMRPDRADVIVPAGTLVQAVMRQAQVEKLVIPGVGMKDGILWSILEKHEDMRL